jgi:hypothetical protein
VVRVTATPLTRNERGVAGGAEALAFTTLILLAGTLVMVNVWSLVETRVALDAAAREYLRTYTHQDDHHAAVTAGELVARAVLTGRDTPLSELRFVHPDPSTFGPCGMATVAISASVPAARVPFIGTLARSRVRIEHHDLIGLHREVNSNGRFADDSTPCSTG